MRTAPLRALGTPLITGLIALVLVALTLLSSGCSRLALPGADRRDTAPAPLAASAPGGALQEVAPPGAVLQVQERLASRNPQVTITAPADDALLPEGPWSLRLQVTDWPLAGGSDGEAGPQVVVQLDQQPPLRLGAAAAREPITMPPLQPGSHRLTVYAARPWGEAVKAPGAWQQIRLHRVGRNAAELPARGSAQLIVASPDGQAQQEPVLIDWLLLDAPLQNLRDDDARWRLRVSVNGDSFLVDRQTPLWLKGFRRGSNAVQLELLDGRGDPLNPPFNSLVREVVIGGDRRPAWLSPSLSASELARLSGEAPAGDPAAAPLPAPAASPAATPPSPEAGADGGQTAEAAAPAQPQAAPVPTEPAPPTQPDSAAEAADAAGPEGEAPLAKAPQVRNQNPEPEPEQTQDPGRSPSPAPRPTTANPAKPAAAPEGDAPLTPDPAAAEQAAPAPTSAPEPPTQTVPNKTAPTQTARTDAGAIAAPARASATGQGLDAEPTEPAEPVQPAEPAAPSPSRSGGTAAARAQPANTSQRLSAGTSLSGSARDQVNADGSLLQPQRRGPLAGLREKLGG